MAYNYQPMGYPYYPVPDQLTQLKQPTNNGIIWVGSETEAVNYLMAPNSAVALWDSNSPCIYLKQTDVSGKPTIKIYDLVERSKMPSNDTKELAKEFVTRDELNVLTARVDALTKGDKGNAESDI